MDPERARIIHQKVTAVLRDGLKVAPSMNPPPMERSVLLNSQEIFSSLVDLYEKMFSEWEDLQDIQFTWPSDVSPSLYASRVYVSGWFIDLYREIRRALSYVSNNPYVEFEAELDRISEDYDDYLVLLIEYISPVTITGCLHNFLYIPVISNRVAVEGDNPFGINDFTLEIGLFNKLKNTMQGSSSWHFSIYPRVNARGHSLWLVDWPDQKHLCLWFPVKDNFETWDQNMCYILGTPLTPNLGVSDVDAWQACHEGGAQPENQNLFDYQRVDRRRYRGHKEVRTFEIDADQMHVAFDGELRPKAPRIRIVDRLYHEYLIVRKMDLNSRVEALKCFSKP